MPVEELDTSIGGLPIRRLTPPPGPPGSGPELLHLDVAPGRGMLILQARVRLASGETTDLFASPPLEEIARRLNGGPEDFAGSASFSLGGALLYPYANRILGTPAERRTIEADVLGRTVTLPRNWGGKAPGARQYAIHGLILDKRFGVVRATDTAGAAVIRAEQDFGDFGGAWLGSSSLVIEAAIDRRGLTIRLQARNAGTEALPVGVGWHPYFALPSGQREQARVAIPAPTRLAVDNYDEVIPTGRLLPVAGTDYDLRGANGRRLGDAYFDDCFVDLGKTAGGELVCTIEDPASGHGVRIRTASPSVRAVQLYAPPDKGYAALEPQFNWPDPFGAEWPPGTDTGIAVIEPGGETSYEVRVEPYAV